MPSLTGAIRREHDHPPATPSLDVDQRRRDAITALNAKPFYDLLDDIASSLEDWRAQRMRTARDEAPDFSVFDFCRTDELGLSEIIGWMLDPGADHCQGTVFLEAFVDHFGIELSNPNCLAKARVALEAATDRIEAKRRRMDIEINCGSFVIGIENKPYAGFQPRQIPDYCRQLAAKAGDRSAFVILKGWSGESPEDQLGFLQDWKCQVADSDYREVQAWVLKCRDRCSAANVKSFLDEFAQFIETGILTGMDSKEEAIVIKLAMENRSRLMAALDLIALSTELYEQMHDLLVSEVRAKLKRGWRLVDASVREKRDSGGFRMTIDYDPRLPVVFTFDMFDGALFATAAIRTRLQKTAPSKRLLKNIQSALVMAIPGFRVPNVETRWIWWANSDALNDADLIEFSESNIWKDAADPASLAQQIVELAARLEKIIRKAD